MKIFFLVWLGQIVSLVGSDLTEFALGVWVYQQTGSVTQFALIVLFMCLPQILISPLAGALVDRWDRRWAMIISDSLAGLVTLGMLLLVFSNQLEIWHIYLAVAIKSVITAFQWPAYTATIPQIVPVENLARANGMVQMSRATGKLLAPVMAAILEKIIHIEGILFIDLSTFVLSLVTLLLVRFPKLSPIEPTTASRKRQGNLHKLLDEIISGWNYIAKREGLLGLLMLFAVLYFTEGILQVLFWPLVLSFASSVALGAVLSIAGCGMLLGSVAISAWGGPKPRMKGILFFLFLQGGCLFLGGLKPSVPIAALGAFGYLFAYPIIVSCNRTIWQSKVPLNLQGRVFALQLTVEKLSSILAYVIAGPLVDQVLDPLLTPSGLLAGSIGKLIGVGRGRGIGLLFILLGMLNILATVVAYRQPRLRRVEKELPDVSGRETSAYG